MNLKTILLAIAAAAAIMPGVAQEPAKAQCNQCTGCSECQKPVVVGAARLDQYIPLLKGKRVALLSNHTGMVGDKHSLDLMLENGVNVVTIFSPEHGFRGKADAGEHVKSGVDEPTGIPIASLYDGKKPGPSQEVMDGLDIIVCDIQDVGLRYYTYYCTMLQLMDAAAANGKQFMVLDRPNPNGMYVDGPILDMEYASGVGRLPITTVHGMTLGELARMIVGEKWLKEGRSLDLTVIPCENYTHQTRYELPVAPSPNLRTMNAIYLYPAVCYFEGTPASLGRGTDMPFAVYGHPDYDDHSFSFTPRSVDGAKNPPQLNNLCYGKDLRGVPDEEAIANGVNFDYVIDCYNHTGRPEGFFTRFFTLLSGRPDIVEMIKAGKSNAEIKATFADDIAAFKKQRKPYLLYAE